MSQQFQLCIMGLGNCYTGMMMSQQFGQCIMGLGYCYTGMMMSQQFGQCIMGLGNCYTGMMMSQQFGQCIMGLGNCYTGMMMSQQFGQCIMGLGNCYTGMMMSQQFGQCIMGRGNCYMSMMIPKQIVQCIMGLGNCYTGTWKMISNSLENDFILSNIDHHVHNYERKMVFSTWNVSYNPVHSIISLVAKPLYDELHAERHFFHWDDLLEESGYLNPFHKKLKHQSTKITKEYDFQ